MIDKKKYAAEKAAKRTRAIAHEEKLDQLCEKIGLVKSSRNKWEVPAGYIVSGAEEHLPGCYRQPDFMRLRGEKVFTKLCDDDGHGVLSEITGITKKPVTLNKVTILTNPVCENCGQHDCDGGCV